MISMSRNDLKSCPGGVNMTQINPRRIRDKPAGADVEDTPAEFPVFS